MKNYDITRIYLRFLRFKRESTGHYPRLSKPGQAIGDEETIYHADGVGLAAPQIGLSIRLMMVDGSELSEDRPELKDFKRLMINPSILEVSEQTVIHQEGCLSVPKLWADIERPESVKLAYLDQDFNLEEWFHGMAAGWSSTNNASGRSAFYGPGTCHPQKNAPK